VNGIQGLAEDVDGTLLVSMRGRVVRVANGKTETAYSYPGPVKQLEAGRLLRDHSGGLWIGTSIRGLVHIHDGRTDVFGGPDGLSGDFITGLFEDREGNIWVATLGGLEPLSRLCRSYVFGESGFVEYRGHIRSSSQGWKRLARHVWWLEPME